MITVNELTKQHPGQAVPTLKGVSFALERGGLAAVLGMSGSGKTTLLRCLVGLERFDGGSISVGNLTVHAGVRKETAALPGHVGLVFQSFELFPHLTVLDNCVLAPCKVKGEARAQAESRARELLADLGLAAKVEAFPDQLSGGQRQRVAIARALTVQPDVLLYDEPTSALDASLKREVLEALLRVRSQGVTQIVVTHDVALAREVAGTVFVLDEGRIAEHGPPAEVLDNPKSDATRRLVLGISSAMSESVGRLIVDLLRRPWTEIGATHYLDEYARSQWLSASALHALQMAKLRHLVWHCVLEVPELRAAIGGALSPSAIEKLDDVTRLPIATAPAPRSERDTRELDARRVAIRARSQEWGATEDKWWMIPTRGVLAAPCRESGDALHVHADHLIVECVGENGTEIKKGQEGSLLLTDLHDLSQPMVRADLGVRGRLVASPCACGRMLPLVALASSCAS